MYETTRLARAIWQACSTPVSLELLGALEREDWDHIVSRRVNPRDYSSAWDYFRDAASCGLLKKNPDLPTTFDRKAEAHRNWWKGERSCKKTNLRLAPYLYGVARCDLVDTWDAEINRHVVGVQREIEGIVGRRPPNLLGKARFGPGSTFETTARCSTLPDKMQVRPTFTPGVLWYLPQWLDTAWGRASARAFHRRDPLSVRGNRFTTAPKDAMKDRPIAVEPSLNLFFQLGMGWNIRRALRRTGVDLDTAQTKHRQVACEASKNGRFATLDLSNASDTVARNCVKLLLPPKWYDALSDLRSPLTKISDDMVHVGAELSGTYKPSRDGRWVQLEKFSSMGNGFTFELETLIFLGISRYATVQSGGDPRDVLVFGDDIIVPTESARAVISLLRWFGFSLNKEKSFVDGPFRESCGGDYFNGVSVRPYHIVGELDAPEKIIVAANGVKRLESQGLDLPGIKSAWFRLLDALPVGIRRCRGPEALGDVVIHDSVEYWQSRWENSIRYVRSYQPFVIEKGLPKWALFDDDVVLACALYGSTWSNGRVIPREPALSYKLDWLPFS